MVEDEGSVAVAAADDTRRAAQLATERELRTVFDCSGTLWGTHRRLDGKPVCHRMPWTGAPDVLDCGVRIEAQSSPGVYVRVEPDSRFAPDEVTERFLYDLGGGRVYRLSLRFKGDTVRNSYITLDLSGMGDARPLPQEVEAARARASAVEAPKPAPAPVDAAAASAALALGADPVAALIGRAVAKIDDPGVQMALAFSLRDSERERRASQERADFLERQFAFVSGMVERMAKGSGDGGAVAAILKAQRDDASRAMLDATKRAQELAEKLHAHEVAAAKGAVEAPSPVAMAFARGLENAIPAMAMQAMQMVPQAAPGVVTLAQAAMAAAAPAAPAVAPVPA